MVVTQRVFIPAPVGAHAQGRAPAGYHPRRPPWTATCPQARRGTDSPGGKRRRNTGCSRYKAGCPAAILGPLCRAAALRAHITARGSAARAARLRRRRRRSRPTPRCYQPGAQRVTDTALSWPADTAVLVPSYCAATSLEQFLPDLMRVVPARQVLVVDDGSGDGTERVCARLGVDYRAHAANRGKGAALRTGFAALAERDISWIVTMDADGQHSIDDLPRMIDAVAAYPQAGLIIGKRAMRLGIMPPARIISNTLTSTLLSVICGARIEDSQCGYRVYAARMLDGMSLRYERFEMESEVILRACHAGYAVKFVPIRTVYSNTQSHIAHVADTLRWIRAVMSVWANTRRAARQAAAAS
ncbi:MAG: glycosyltransferase [Chitinivibrionales bacterium]|nr:glycosyltransferase [Chitinivibrionales bacterium]